MILKGTMKQACFMVPFNIFSLMTDDIERDNETSLFHGSFQYLQFGDIADTVDSRYLEVEGTR